MNTQYDLIIVGLGAAGLMAAANSSGLKTLVLERNAQGGKKVLISGKGQCNFTHHMEAKEMAGYFGGKENFVKHALGKFNPSQTRAYFKNLGVDSLVMENGKVFPKSLEASDLVETLLNEALDHHVEIQFKSRVNDISKGADGLFKVSTLRQVMNAEGELVSAVYYAKAVLLTTGGLTYPVTGSEGDGYHLATALGHSVVRPRPALAPIYHAMEPLKALAGVSIPEAVIKHSREGRVLKSYVGDLLFTHKGLSGPVILNNSRNFEAGDILQLAFTPLSEKELDLALLEAANKNGKGLIRSALRQWCYTRSIADFLAEAMNLNEQMSFSQMNKALRSQIVSFLTKFTVKMERIGGPEIGMVTAGGVSLEEVKAKTLASSKVEGLYFAGEVLDIDGDTGGYNIQWAFSSAMAAVSDIKSKYN